MPYRIKVDETPLDGLRRAVREQMDRALADLDRPDRHEAVHEFRKRCKKIRALLRLFRGAMGDAYARENRWFRDAARKLSELRDATSLLETCVGLADSGDIRARSGLLQPAREALALRRTRLVEAKELEERLEACREMTREGRGRVVDWSLDEEGFQGLAAGLEKTYRRARKGLPRAYRNSTTEAFHEWRKRVKYHRYHLRLLRDVWRPVLDPWREELHRLSDLLGEDHDLAVFGRTLEDSSYLEGVDHRAEIAELIEGRRRKLQEEARPLGERLFAESPGAVVDRFATYWKAARA